MHALQLFASTKCARFNTLNARWEDDLFKATTFETTYPDSLETFWELDVLQPRARQERAITDLFQHAPLLEDHLFQIPAILKGFILDLLDALRNDYPFNLTLIDSSRFDLLESFIQYNRL